MGYKNTRHDIQNELLYIMNSTIFIVKVLTIHDLKFFSIMAHEVTDFSNIEQLSFCIRYVDDNLDVSEDFMGLWKLDSIKSETIVNAIKDTLLRCHLNLDN